MVELNDNFKDLKLAIFDLDGVIYRGNELIGRTDKIIQHMKNLSIEVRYNSNNSTITRDMYVKKLEKMNITSKTSDYYTSASITAQKITEFQKNAIIYIIGEIGLKKELEKEGHSVIDDISRYEEVDFVIVGLDRDFDYEKLADAQRCIIDGHAKFYATNEDSTLPGKGRILPGAGTMVNALKTCTSQEPIEVFGKPQTTGVLSILNDINIDKENTYFFGDRLNTDILAGNRAGVKTVLVLTGVTSREKIKELQNKKKNAEDVDIDLFPDYIIDSLEEIIKE
jgi:phosphoglycolate/pyridoxal phosphate phosphatase family enzyme